MTQLQLRLLCCFFIDGMQYQSKILKFTSLLLIFSNEKIRNTVIVRIESTYSGELCANPEVNYNEEKY